MASKGERRVRDDARVWSPRDWNNSVAVEMKGSLEFGKKRSSVWGVLK